MTDLLEREPRRADFRIPYGSGEFQFGDLWLPRMNDSAERFPVLVFLHGGWWKAAYGLGYAGQLCAELKTHGVACWSLEYRRVGDPGGGWPGTFQDVGAGFDHLAILANQYPLDLDRIAVVGHSAGGHLAFWLAGRERIPEASVLRVPQPRLGIRTVVALAGAVDLTWTVELAQGIFAHGGENVVNLMGGAPEDLLERYAAGDPGKLLPLRIPQILLQGSEDDQIPAQLPQRWVDRGRSLGEAVQLVMLPKADHMDVVDPESTAWPEVRRTIVAALG